MRNSFLGFLHSDRWTEEAKLLTSRGNRPRSALYRSARNVAWALDDLLAWILRDFVAAWYINISPNPSFINEVESAIRDALIAIGLRLAQIDLVELGVSQFVPLISRHLQDYAEAEKAVRGKRLEKDLTESDELDFAIAAKYRNGRLHPATSRLGAEAKLARNAHLRTLSKQLLPLVMSTSQSNSKAVMVLVREIVACSVLSPVLQILTDGDTWNQVIEGLGRDVMQDRRTVKKLRAALDEHASPQGKRTAQRGMVSHLKPYDSDRRFEQFIRSIRHCSDINEARSWRDELGSQLSHDSQNPNIDAVYLRRLETCRKLLERKVQSMSGEPEHSSANNDHQRLTSAASLQLDRMSLGDVLHNTSALSYFLEFLDRRGQSYLAQYWLLVDKLRGSFELDKEFPSKQLALPKTADYEILLHIKQLYFGKPDLDIAPEQELALSTFTEAGSQATAMQYKKARNAIFQVQADVYEQMNKTQFVRFRSSDLFSAFKEHELRTSRGTSTASPTDGPSYDLPGLKKPVARVPPSALPRSNSSLSLRSQDMRRAALSNSGLLGGADTDDGFLAPRRTSTESTRKRSIFGDDDDDYKSDFMFRDGMDQESMENTEGAVKAMETALTGIMAEADESPSTASVVNASRSPENSLFFSRDDTSSRSSRELVRPEASKNASLQDSKGNMPTLSSLGLVNKSIRIGVFSDSDLFPDDEVRFAEDEQTDNSSLGSDLDDDTDEVQAPVPGDLGLSEAICALNIEIRRLVAQEAVLDSLVKKAELVNNAAEIRILGKSKSSLAREIKRKEMRRQQYMVQEGDSGLYGRSNIHIKSTIVGQEDNGHEYALYIIEVQRLNDEQLVMSKTNGNGSKAGSDVAAQWAVARRYSEFHALHRRLRQLHPAVRDLEFPRRKVVARFGREFLEKRRRVLESYLRQLLHLPDVCRSRDFRAFLSQQAIPTANSGETGSIEDERQDLISRLFQTVSSGVEDVAIDFPVLEHLSMSIPLGVNLSALPSIMNPSSSSNSEDPRQAAEAEAELSAFQSQHNRATDKEPFVKPICDLFLELFDLNSSQSWLRGRAVVLVLHQLLGGTIERRIRDQYAASTSPQSLIKYIDLLKTSIWEVEAGAPGKFPDTKSPPEPTSRLKRDRKPRTAQERARSKIEANILLQTLVPDLAGGVVGRANAKSAARKLFAVLNNAALMEHLVFCVFDEVMSALFGEDVVPKYDVKGQLASDGSGDGINARKAGIKIW